VYSQQETYFTKKEVKGCPRKVMLDELVNLVKSAQDEGDEIMVMMDSNDYDVRTGHTNKALSELGLVEIISHRHDSDDNPMPNTYIDGSRPIDGIWVSAGLVNSRCGYLHFDDGPPGADHCVLWIELSVDDVFGNYIEHWKPKARRLKTEDPRIVKAYNDRFHEFCVQRGLYHWAENLQFRADTFGLSPTLMYEYKMLDSMCREGMAYAERKCRKLKMGAVEFSEDLGFLMAQVEAWKLMRRKLRGQHVGRKRFHRVWARAKLGPVDQQFTLPLVRKRCGKQFE
jgi:hypothetical protein